MSFLRTPGGPLGNGHTRLEPEESAFVGEFPALYEYLTATRHPTGAERVTSTVTVFAESGLLKAVVKDRDAAATLWASGSTWEGLLASLEDKLRDPLSDWREDRNTRKR